MGPDGHHFFVPMVVSLMGDYVPLCETETLGPRGCDVGRTERATVQGPQWDPLGAI